MSTLEDFRRRIEAEQAAAGTTPSAFWCVFAQQAHPVLDTSAWSAQGARHFGVTLSLLGEETTNSDGCTIHTLARFTLSSGDHRADGIVVGTMALEADWTRAEQARARGAGLDALARRCKTVWRIDSADPRDALLVSAVLASVVLGPILSPDGEIFGVRGARERLSQRIDQTTRS